MRKVLFLAAVFVLMLQVPAFAEVKIGVVVVPKAVLTCEYGKEMEKQLKTRFEPLQKEIEKEANELKKMESEIRNQDLALKLDAKQDRQREFRRKIRDLQDSRVAYNQKLQAENQKLRQPIMVRLNKIINEYAKANNYTMILQAAGGVLYAQPGVDITDAIIVELNKLKKAGK